jgi:hypothetical protein
VKNLASIAARHQPFEGDFAWRRAEASSDRADLFPTAATVLPAQGVRRSAAKVATEGRGSRLCAASVPVDDRDAGLTKARASEAMPSCRSYQDDLPSVRGSS